MDSSPFAQLPRELRDLIYHYTFTTPSDRASTLQDAQIQHPLTRTCRALRDETLALYFSLTRFNAHLDDGPATPLARWLVAMGAQRCLGLREVNVWDMHMLNGVLHGQKAAEAMLRDGPPAEEASPLAPPGSHNDSITSNDDGNNSNKRQSTPSSSSSSYILRPIGRDTFDSSFSLAEILLALQCIGLQLRRFCEVQDSSLTSSPPGQPTGVKQTSHFAIQPSSPSAAASPLGPVDRFGLDGMEQAVLLQRLERGEREIGVPIGGRREVAFEFEGEGRRLMGMRQWSMPLRRED